MTPDQLAALTSLISIIDKVSQWPFGLIFLVVIIGPWVMALMIGWAYRRRFEEVVKMYENNVTLAKGYERVCTDLRDIVIMNTQGWTEATKAIESNQYCPLNRIQRLAGGPGT